MRIKDNKVRITGFTPELLLGLLIVNEVYKEYGAECLITCGAEGVHSVTSLHYSGNAVDLRRYADIDMEGLVRECKERLRLHYDIVLEHDHVHLEYQPRYS